MEIELKNIKCETNINFRHKRSEYFKHRINEGESQNKNIKIIFRDINGVPTQV
jgi:hypothetical protein